MCPCAYCAALVPCWDLMELVCFSNFRNLDPVKNHDDPTITWPEGTEYVKGMDINHDDDEVSYASHPSVDDEDDGGSISDLTSDSNTDSDESIQKFSKK